MQQVYLIMLLTIVIISFWYIVRAIRLDARARQFMIKENSQAFMSFRQKRIRAYRGLCLGGACGFAIFLGLALFISPHLWLALTQPRKIYWGVGDSIIIGWVLFGVFGGVIGAVLGLLSVRRNKHT